MYKATRPFLIPATLMLSIRYNHIELFNNNQYSTMANHQQVQFTYLQLVQIIHLFKKVFRDVSPECIQRNKRQTSQ